MKKKIKTILSLFLALTILFSASFTAIPALTASAETVTGTSGIFTYEITDGEVTITDCDSSASGEVIVPSAIEGYPVTVIGESAFSSCDEITKIILPDTIIIIESGAFFSIYSLTEIDFGNSVTRIEESAFQSTNISNIEFPDSLIVMEEQHIFNADIYIGKNVRSIDFEGTWANSFTVSDDNPYYSSSNGVLFSKDKKELIRYPARSEGSTYTVPSSVETICKKAFIGSENLTSVIIPDNVKYIGEGAFNNCANLSSISLGSGVEYISRYAFYNNAFYNDTNNWINGILYVGNCAISYNSSIPANAEIKNGTRVIAENCFASVPSETIKIPDTVKYICDYAFYGSKLVNIEIPDSVIFLGEWAIRFCDNMESVVIGDGLKELKSATITGNKITSIKLGTGLEYIGITAIRDTAFFNDANNYNGNELVVDGHLIKCEYSTNGTYYISKDIRSVAEGAFRICTQVTNFSVDENNPYFSTDEHGVLFNKDKTVLIAFPVGNSLTEYTVPASVKKIGEYAFEYCNNLMVINLPEGLTEIGGAAFSSLYSLTQINLPESLQIVGEYAFNYCYNLENIYLGSNVKSIGRFAFSECDKIKSVTVPDSVTNLEENVFYNCDALENLKLGNGIESINAVFDSSALKTVTISKSIIKFEDLSFSGLDSLTDIYYTGTKNEWRAITKGYNEGLDNVTIHYNATGNEGHVHSYTGKVTTEATCSESGTRTYTCSCGSSYTETIAKLTHSASDWVITKYPTSSEEGLKVKTCIHCNEIMESEFLPVINDYTDSETGIIIQFPDKIETDPDISSILDSSLFDIIGRTIRILKGKAFSIILNLAQAASGKTYIVKIPLPSGYNPETTRVFAVDSASGTSYIINSTYSNGYIIFEISADCTVVIAEIYDESLYGFESAEISINKNKKVNLNLTAPAGYYIVYKSSDPSVVEVDSSGNVLGLSAGTAVITAYVDGTDIVYECTVTVTLTWWQALIQAILSFFIALISIFL